MEPTPRYIVPMGEGGMMTTNNLAEYNFLTRPKYGCNIYAVLAIVSFGIPALAFCFSYLCKLIMH